MAHLEKVFDNDKKFEDYAAKHTQGYEDTEKALEIVKKFIIDKNLIIYGGMAIDLALKAKGHKGIYKEDAVPDYDFMSPTHYDHACELAILLDKHGFKECQAVNAVHVSTYKVRTNFVWVADITYIPANIFKTMPTMTSKDGLRFVHPDFQRMDMHRAMSTPYEKPPLEVFLNRARKDQKRFRMINEFYPLSILNKIEVDKKANIKENMQTWTVPIKYYDNNVIGGTQAYIVMWAVMNEIINGKSKLAKSMTLSDEIRKQFAELPKSDLKFEKNSIIFQLEKNNPELAVVNVISDDYESTLRTVASGKNSDPTYFNRYIDDLRPRTILVEDDKILIEIFDNKPRLLPSYNLQNVLRMVDITFPSSNVKVCTPQYALMYFLQKYYGGGFVKNNAIELDANRKQIFLQMYVAMQNMVIVAESIYLSLVKDKDKAAIDAINKVFAELPFFLTDRVYGSTNWSPDYIVGVRKDYYYINHTPVHLQEVMKPPNGYYLKGPKALFDYKKSEFFQFDGQKSDVPFDPVELMLKQPILKDNVTPPSSPVIEKKSGSNENLKKRYNTWIDLNIL